MISVARCHTKEVKCLYLRSAPYCTYISIQTDTPSKSLYECAILQGVQVASQTSSAELPLVREHKSAP